MLKCGFLVTLLSLSLTIRNTAGQFVAIKRESSTYVCTGILIDADYIVTNAKCVVDSGTLMALEASKVLVHKIINEKIDETGFTAENIFVPDNSTSSDIAIIHINPPLTDISLGVVVSVAIEQQKPFSECQMYGLRDNILHIVNVTVIDTEVCNSTQMYNGALAKNLVCTSVRIGDNGANKCQFNFGSALLCEGKLSGVLSFGSQCVEDVGNLGIYADLSRYQDWIDQVFRRMPAKGSKIPVEIVTEPTIVANEATTEVINELYQNDELEKDVEENSLKTTTESPENNLTTLLTIEDTTTEDVTTLEPSTTEGNKILKIIDNVLKSLQTTADEIETKDFTTTENIVEEETSTPRIDEPKTPSTLAPITIPPPNISSTTPEPKVVIITPSNYRQLKNGDNEIKFETRELPDSVTTTTAPSVIVDKSDDEAQPILDEMTSTSVTSSTSATFDTSAYCTTENRNCFAEWKFMDIQGYEMTNYRCMNELQTYSCLYIKRQDVKVKPVGERVFIQNTHNHYYLINPPESLIAAPLPIPMLGQKVESFVPSD